MMTSLDAPAGVIVDGTHEMIAGRRRQTAAQVAAFIAAAMGTGLSTFGAVAAPAIEADPRFVVGYFKGFVSSCRPEVKGDPDIGKLACSCAAAIIADRFSIDDLKSLQGKGIEDYDKLHAGTSKMIGICGAAAKGAVTK